MYVAVSLCLCAPVCICAYWRFDGELKISSPYVCLCVGVDNATLHMWSSDAPAGCGTAFLIVRKSAHFALNHTLMCRYCIVVLS